MSEKILYFSDKNDIVSNDFINWRPGPNLVVDKSIFVIMVKLPITRFS